MPTAWLLRQLPMPAMKLHALLAAVALFTTACGGGGSSASATPDASAAPLVATTSTPAAGTAASAAGTAAPAAAPTTPTPSATPATATPSTPTVPTTTPVTTPTTTPATPTTTPTTPPATPPATGTTTPPPVATPAAPTLVEYYGDSIVWGWMPNTEWGRVDQPEPAIFAADTKFNVANMGSPGRLAEHALAGDTVYPAWTQQMAQSKASHVIIEYHSHDSVANTTARVRQLIQIAKAAGKKVIIETIGPGNHGDGTLSYKQISDAQRAAAAAEGVPVIDQTAYLDQYLTSTGKSVWDICGDGLHPNPDIYIMKGHYAAKQFATMQ